ncbi:MAG: fumarate hydratase, partial [Clostridiales bacterium]|nr:fumarate hydratase [Clostridiales bacterium]
MKAIRVIEFERIASAVADLCGKAACDLPPDVLAGLRNSGETEQSELGRDFFRQYLENARIAASDRMPLCQDTGFAVYFVELGDQVQLDRGTIYEAIAEGTRRGYKDHYLRKSIVSDPLFDRRNTFDNTPAVIHLTLVEGESVKILLAPKGGGSENMSAVKMLKPSDGRPVAVPSQDMVLGSYYLTMEKDGEIGEGKVFRDFDEALMAYACHYISLHAKIRVRHKNPKGETKLISTTVGRIIFNSPIPQDLGFVDRNDPEKSADLEINFLVGKKQLGLIVDACIKNHGTKKTSEVLDDIKALGFKYSTRGAITVAVGDAVIPPAKKEIVAKAETEIDAILKQY